MLSKFAKRIPVQVPIDLSIDECFQLLPTELIVEIFKYLNMGIILSLFEEKKKVILYCIQLERFDRGKGFCLPSILHDYENKELIDLIITSKSINQKYIMRHFIDYKRREKQEIERKRIETERKETEFQQLKPGDFIVFQKKSKYDICIIISKTKKMFKCIEICRNPLKPNTIQIYKNTINHSTKTNIGKIINGKYTSIGVETWGKHYLNNAIKQKNVLNLATEIIIKDSGIYSRENVLQFVLDNYQL